MKAWIPPGSHPRAKVFHGRRPAQGQPGTQGPPEGERGGQSPVKTELPDEAADCRHSPRTQAGQLSPGSVSTAHRLWRKGVGGPRCVRLPPQLPPQPPNQMADPSLKAGTQDGRRMSNWMPLSGKEGERQGPNNQSPAARFDGRTPPLPRLTSRWRCPPDDSHRSTAGAARNGCRSPVQCVHQWAGRVRQPPQRVQVSCSGPGPLLCG